MLDLERRTLLFIGEDPDSPDVFADTSESLYSVRASLSDAISEINMLAGGYTERVLLPLVAGQAFYRIRFLRGAFGWVRSAWLVNQSAPLEQTDPIILASQNPRWLEDSRRPESYMQIGADIIGVAPKPSDSSDVVALDCVVIPAALDNDDDRIKLRQEHEWAAMQYAASEFYASRGDANRAAELFTGYLETLGSVTQHVRTQDRQYQARDHAVGG